MKVISMKVWIQRSLTDAGVKADACVEDIVSREVNGVAGEAEMAAD